MLLYFFEATFVLDKTTTVKFQPTWLQCTPYQVSISQIGKVPLYRVHFIVGPTFPIFAGVELKSMGKLFGRKTIPAQFFPI